MVFYKERKRMQRMKHSFIKNARTLHSFEENVCPTPRVSDLSLFPPFPLAPHLYPRADPDGVGETSGPRGWGSWGVTWWTKGDRVSSTEVTTEGRREFLISPRS